MLHHILRRRNTPKKLFPIHLAGFLFSFHLSILIYINSSFLGNYFNSTFVSLIYIGGALGSIILLLISVRLQNWLGNRRFLELFLLIELISVCTLALTNSPLWVALFFMIFEATSVLIIYSLDIFLEDATPEERTGRVRGIYLTLGNLAVVLSPLVIALVAPNGEFTHLYVVSALILLPIFLIALYAFNDFKDGKKEIPKLPFKAWWHSNNIRRDTMVRFALSLFYSIVVIYSPLYLRNIVGFTWTEISIIFTIMLLPFVLFEIPLGRLADKLLGEKEIMTTGLFIMGTTLIIMPFMNKPLMIPWIIILFASRVGASMVEVTVESYFFKHVNKNDEGLISIFRLTQSVSYIIGPIIGAVVIAFLPFEAMFFILALVMLKAMSSSTLLQDTR
ncbi:MAG: MFS transporter [Minisyncoccia bacterium]